MDVIGKEVEGEPVRRVSSSSVKVTQALDSHVNLKAR